MAYKVTKEEFLNGIAMLHEAAVDLTNGDVKFRNVAGALANVAAVIDPELAQKMRGNIATNLEAQTPKPRFGTKPPPARKAVPSKYNTAKKVAPPVSDQIQVDKDSIKGHKIQIDEDVENPNEEGNEGQYEDDKNLGIDGDSEIPVKDQKVIAAKENSGMLKTIDAGLLESWASTTPQALSNSMDAPSLVGICETLNIETKPTFNKSQLAAAIIKVAKSKSESK